MRTAAAAVEAPAEEEGSGLGRAPPVNGKVKKLKRSAQKTAKPKKKRKQVAWRPSADIFQ